MNTKLKPLQLKRLFFYCPNTPIWYNIYMKKLLGVTIIIAVGVIFFAPIFERSEPTCICFNALERCPCNYQSLWSKLVQ